MATSAAQIAKTGKYGDLRRRLVFLLLALVVYRVGAHIPVPGINPDQLAQLFKGQQGGILSLFNMFSGGALSRFTVFALGIMPYISASIIMQLLTYVVPTFEQLKKEGEAGRRKITQYTRYGTLGLALFQSLGIAMALEGSAGLVMNPGFGFRMTAVVSLTAGTMFLMWLGEQITERGLGNGISILIFAGIAAGLAQCDRRTAGTGSHRRHEHHRRRVHRRRRGAGDLLRGVRGTRPAQDPGELCAPSGRQQGLRRPVVAPAAEAEHGRRDPADLRLVDHPAAGNRGELVRYRRLACAGSRTSPARLSPGQPIYVMLYASAIVFFCFFYTALVFNSRETADNLKKSGAFIPGIRPGEQTARYIDKILVRLTLAGAVYITFVCLLPEFLILKYNVPFYFGGTSLLIIVVVTMDFMAQVQNYLMSQQYESLLKKANFKTSLGG